MYKYIGDSILNASFTVQVPKPLDNRTVVNNLQELYSIPPAYAYLGMTVANIDNGNIYMLVDKSKIYEKGGWKASYESIQIIACTYQEYKEWEQNTNEHFQPIDSSIEYLHQDTYYYIFEETLPGEEENQEYVKRSDWVELSNAVSGKASNDALILTNQEVARIARDYATKQFVIDGYVPLATLASMFDLEDTESFVRTNFLMKNEIEGVYVRFADLSASDDPEDFIFVTAQQYETDQQALEQYKANLSEELTHFLRVGQDGELGNIIVSQIKSPSVNNQQLVVNVTPEGFKVGDDRFAMLSDVPPHVTLTKEQYEALVENDEVDPDTYYHITGDEETYVLQSDLNRDYYTKTQTESFVSGYTFSQQVITQKIDNVVSMLSNYYTSNEVDNLFVKKTDLTTTLEDYVTIAMLGGDDMEGQFIFVKASDYQTDQEALARQRTDDLLAIETDYVKKNSNAALTSLETDTIKKGANTLTIADVLKFNNKKLALDEDVPVIQVVSAEEYAELQKDPNIYYFIYNTDPDLSFVTAQELTYYYTKTQVDSLLVPLKNRIQALEELTQSLVARLDALDGGGGE